MIMPTIPLAQLPKTSSAEEFEHMCKDVLESQFQIDFQMFARKGQLQNGIDVISPNNEKYIVAQCKNYYASTYNKLKKQILIDVQSTVKWQDQNPHISIEKFIVMTSLNRDTETQMFVDSIKVPFKVIIQYWEDIQEAVCSKPDLLQKYYPNLFNGVMPAEAINLLISSANNLKKLAEHLNQSYKKYRPAYHYSDDVVVYNECVQIALIVNELLRVRDSWYIQCEDKKINKPIEKLTKLLPPLYDENSDGTGGSMICTITDYLGFFTDNEKEAKFVKQCEKIIARTKE